MDYFCDTFNLNYMSVYPVLTLISASIMLALSFCFLLLKTPSFPSLYNYLVARRILAVTYFVLGCSNALSLIIDDTLSNPKVETYGILIIAAFQAILFTFTTITLINTRYVNIKTVLREIIPVVSLSLLLLVFSSKNAGKAEQICYYVFCTYYVSLLIRYTYLFFKQEHLYKEKADNFFSDVETKRLAWVRWAYIGALLVGITAFFAHLSSRNFAMIFTGVYLFYYLYFAIRFINYAQMFQIVEPVIVQESVSELEDKLPEELGLRIKEWVEKKKFLAAGITINELAGQLNTNRTYLSNYINTDIGMNFKTWIIGLKLVEAKILMLDNPDMSISEVADRTGYNDQSTFNRQFSKSEGISPRTWRKQ